ncbi:MAG: Coenzyme F420 hydrogenase/dehydrogenase, beta subunit C-terminal domain [Candidatus Thorarchaeota archaeon]
MGSESNISWEFLKNLADTLDSYRIRVLIDAKEDILNAGIYNEDQYYNIFLKTFDEEQLKNSLLCYLNNNKNKKDFNLLKKFSKKNEIDIRRTLSLLELLKNENLLAFKIVYDKIQEENSEENILTFKDILIETKNINLSETKSVYEPVSIIFESKVCSGCGLCSGICPVNCLNVYNGFGKIDQDKCIRCGLCYYHCPRTYLPITILNMLQSDSSEIENYSNIGHYIGVYSARTKIKEISEICQDGGISSTCLHYLFENNQIDYALGATMSRTPWRPEPKLLINKSDVLLTSGTKYVNNPNLRILNELNDNGSNIAIVGVPCMMQGLLKSQIYNIGIPSLNKVKYRIGIFCMESFSYQSFLEICNRLNVDVDDIKKTDINKGKFFVYTKSGEEFTIPVKEISNLAREDCEVCFDLTSESADISLGSTGSPPGWNTVIVRTLKGKKLFENLVKDDLIEYKDIKDVKPGFPMLEKIALSKKNNCYKHIEQKQKENKRIPQY